MQPLGDEPREPDDTVVDPAVLAERRARRADSAESALRSRAAEAATLERRLADTTARLEVVQLESDRLARSLRDARRELVRAEQREFSERAVRVEIEARSGAELRKRSEAVERGRLALREARHRISELESERAALEGALGAARFGGADLARLRGEVEARTAQQADIVSQVGQLRLGLDAALASMRGLVDSEELAGLRRALRATEGRAAQAEARLAETEQRLAGAEQSARDAVARALVAERETAAAAAVLSEASGLDERVAAAEQRAAEAEDRAAQLDVLVADLSGAADTLTSGFQAALAAEHEALGAEVAELSARLEAIRAEIAGGAARLQVALDDERRARREADARATSERELRVRAVEELDAERGRRREAEERLALMRPPWPGATPAPGPAPPSAGPPAASHPALRHATEARDLADVVAGLGAAADRLRAAQPPLAEPAPAAPFSPAPALPSAAGAPLAEPVPPATAASADPGAVPLAEPAPPAAAFGHPGAPLAEPAPPAAAAPLPPAGPPSSDQPRHSIPARVDPTRVRRATPWLAPAFAALASSEPEAALRVLEAAAPLMSVRLQGELVVDLEVDGYERRRLTLGGAGPREPDAVIAGPLGAFGPIALGGTRWPRTPPGLRLGGSRRKARRLLRAMRRAPGLGGLAEAGVELAAADVVALVAASPSAPRVNGHAATRPTVVAIDTGQLQLPVLALAAEGGLTRGWAESSAADAVLHATPRGLLAGLAGEAAVVVTGQQAAAVRVLAALDQLQNG